MAGEGDTGSGKNILVRRLAIGRRISEYIIKSHNARLRYNTYDSFIKLIQANRGDFESVWKRRMGIPKKRREGQDFLNALRAHEFEKPESQKMAMRLLWLIEQMEREEKGQI